MGSRFWTQARERGLISSPFFALQRCLLIDERIEELVRWFSEATNAVALTGAGVSTESGIPDFRSPSGFWQGADPAEVASVEGFLSDPIRFYRFWSKRLPMLRAAAPNIVHDALAELGRRGQLRAIITQNIDGLHQHAGSERVLEIHGSYRTARCLNCGHRCSTDELIARFDGVKPPRCPACGQGPMKPDTILFGEPLPPAFDEAELLVGVTDLFVVLGSSLGVYPAASLVPRARSAGARIVLLNREAGPFDEDADLVIHGELGETMEALLEAALARSD